MDPWQDEEEGDRERELDVRARKKRSMWFEVRWLATKFIVTVHRTNWSNYA